MSWYAKKLLNIANQALVIDEVSGRDVAVVYRSEDSPLLAAAPLMLEVLESADEVLGTDRGLRNSGLHQAIKEAICQAKEGVA